MEHLDYFFFLRAVRIWNKSFIFNSVGSKKELGRIISNAGWLFFDKILRLGVGFFVGVWLARYLGPEQFGILSYLLALLSIFAVFSSLGLKDIVVKDIVRIPDEANEYLGTALILQLSAGLVSWFAFWLTMAFLEPGNNWLQLSVIILGATLVFKATDVVKYWFESQVNSRYVIFIESSILILMAGLKVAMIIAKAPLNAFILLIVIEAAFIAAGLIFIYSWKEKLLFKWRFKLSRATTLVRDSWPLMLSGFAIMIYMRIDQIMIDKMLGHEALGLYSAALRISELWYALPMIITASMFPSIMEAREKDKLLYGYKLRDLLGFCVAASFVIAIVVTLLADWLVTVLFGYSYQGAASVLKVHIWAFVFVSLGVVGSRWYVSEGLQKLSFYRTFCGALVNIVLNLFFIRWYGIIGAAVSTLISYAIAAYFFDALSRKTRALFNYKTIALSLGLYRL